MKHGSPVWIVWLEAFRILDLRFSFYIGLLHCFLFLCSVAVQRWGQDFKPAVEKTQLTNYTDDDGKTDTLTWTQPQKARIFRNTRNDPKLWIIVKTEVIRKSRNFNFQWTKTLYQNNLNNIAFFFFLHFSRAIDIISYL